MVKLYVLFLLLGLTGIIQASDNCIKSIVVNLDSTAIRNLNATPVQLIPQPPAGHYIQLKGMDVKYNQGTIAYPPNALLAAYHLGSSEGAYFSVSLYKGVPFMSGWPPINGGEMIADAPVMLTITDTSTLAGNGSISVIVTYRVVSMTGTTVCDTVTSTSGGQGGECKQIVNLTSTQILNLHSTPQTLLPAPPSGKYIQVKYIITFFSFNTTPYSVNTQLEVFFTDTLRPTGGNAVTLLDTVSTMRSFGVNQGGASYEMASPLKIRTKNGNPVNGDSDIELLIIYEVVDSGVSICSGINGALPYVKDSVLNLTLDTVYLQLNTENIIVAQGKYQNLVYMFPSGTDGDVIKITNTQNIDNVIPDGVGFNTITPRRAAELISETEVTLRWAQSGWY